MNKEEFVKEQMKLSKEDIIANYWYTYQDNVEKLGIEHQLKLKDKEIEKLKQGYCPIKEKCNKGECDCTNEEYNQMCEENIKLELEIERLNKEEILSKIRSSETNNNTL